jgi:hypothetical protein
VGAFGKGVGQGECREDGGCEEGGDGLHFEDCYLSGTNVWCLCKRMTCFPKYGKA